MGFNAKNTARKIGAEPDGEPRLLRISQVAAKLGVSVSTAYRWAAAGRLPTVEIGQGRRRVPAAALDAWTQTLAEAAVDSLRAADEADLD
jgi:excisionase family DNA binding protein